MVLLGKVEHQLDAKKRIRIPNKFRKLLPQDEALHFVRYTPGCIAVMSDSVLAKRLISAVGELDPSNDEFMRAQRFLSSCVEDVTEDTQGRIMISKAMREHAGIGKDTVNMVTVGMGDFLEIWVAENYEADLAGMTVTMANNIAKQNRAVK